jgi:internalin A
MRKKTFLVLLFLSVLFLGGCSARVIPHTSTTIVTRNDQQQTIFFRDEDIAQAVLSQTGKQAQETLTDDDLLRIQTIFVNDGDLRTDIQELAQLKNMTELHLEHYRLADLSVLCTLQKLKKLTLRDCGIVDVRALSSLQNLEELDLSDNFAMVEIDTLKSIQNLKHLSLSGVDLADITPLGTLHNLEKLDLSQTRVSDISPLVGLKKLRILCLMDTPVHDIKPLQKLALLEELLWGYEEFPTEEMKQQSLELQRILPNCKIDLKWYSTGKDKIP